MMVEKQHLLVEKEEQVGVCVCGGGCRCVCGKWGVGVCVCVCGKWGVCVCMSRVCCVGERGYSK